MLSLVPLLEMFVDQPPRSKKVKLYSAVSGMLDRSKRFTLHHNNYSSDSSRPVHIPTPTRILKSWGKSYTKCIILGISFQARSRQEA